MRRLLLALMFVLLAPAAARAATLDPIGTFQAPVYVTSEPADPDRLLVVEQRGTIELSDHGVVSPFLDLTAPDPDLLTSGNERGLLSVALAPDYATSHHLYVDYTRPDGDLEVDEFTAAGNIAPLSSRRPLLTIEHSTYANHNGGQLQFGPDGYLYIGTGDGGGGGDPFQSGQSTTTLLGKILRIDPNPAGPAPYSIPPGNPFAGPTAGADEIWSYGLRNPWRFSFDRLTAALLIGDVGQDAREEVDYSPAPVAGRGLNFGWNCREGLIAYTSPGTSCTGTGGFTDPIFDYGHTGSNCAITGGYVVRDASLGDLYGRYVFADECAGQISSLVPGFPATGERSEGLAVGGPSSFGEDSCGRLYVASLGSGEVSRFVGTTPADCRSSTPVEDRPTCGGRPATRVPGAGSAVDGSPGDDVIVADGRDNRIKAGAGDDIVCGLAGDDVIKGGPGKDTLRGGRGNDRCRAAKVDRTRSC